VEFYWHLAKVHISARPFLQWVRNEPRLSSSLAFPSQHISQRSENTKLKQKTHLQHILERSENTKLKHKTHLQHFAKASEYKTSSSIIY
jgi:hypothetical protein